MSSTIITPGPSLIQAAQALEVIQRGSGKFPYQWIYPGPNARPVVATGILTVPGPPIPAIPKGTSADVVTYAVPTGERFSLRGVVFAVLSGTALAADNSNFNWSLIVRGAATRTVEGFAKLTVPFGSVNNGAGGDNQVRVPFPLPGTLEMNQRDTVAIIVTVTNNAGLASTVILAQLWGHNYPNSEAI